MSLDIYQQHLDHCGSEHCAFLDRIFTKDKTRMHYCKPEGIQQSTEWKQPQSPSKKKIKKPTICRKTYAFNLSIFGTHKAQEYYHDGATTVNSAHYK
jgi:hypothetical protein